MAFIKACDRFIYLSVINRKVDMGSSAIDAKESVTLKNVVTAAINDLADESGYAFLADVGNLINKRRPDFDPRHLINKPSIICVVESILQLPKEV